MKADNRALNYLLANRQPFDAKTQKAVDSFPQLYKSLAEYSLGTAEILIKPFAEMAFKKRDRRSRSRAIVLELAKCITDLQLTQVFGWFEEFTGDADIASMLTDAMLFEATGLEPTRLDNTDILVGSTKHIRGIYSI